LSHKNPVLCLQWFPSNVEIDKKNIQNYSTPNPRKFHNKFIITNFWRFKNLFINLFFILILILLIANEIHQFATISCDGMILIWDNRFLDPKDKKGTTVDVKILIISKKKKDLI
jgi:hypothetical protein